MSDTPRAVEQNLFCETSTEPCRGAVVAPLSSQAHARHPEAPWPAGQDGLVACYVDHWRLPRPVPQGLADEGFQGTPASGWAATCPKNTLHRWPCNLDPFETYVSRPDPLFYCFCK